MFQKNQATNYPRPRIRLSQSPARRNISFWLLATTILASVFGSNHNLIQLPNLPAMTAVSAMRTVATSTLRRSARLRGLSSALPAASDPVPDPPKKTQKRTRSTAAKPKTSSKKTKTAAKPKKSASKKKQDDADELWCLPRTRETSILSSSDAVQFVMGVDEAGRGPLAGPVVAAAAIVPTDIDGITDSKKITKEQDREDLYKLIVNSPNVKWAVAVMDAAFIDKVNILQATMRGMEAASIALAAEAGPSSFVQVGDEKVPVLSEIDHEQYGCYVVTSHSSSDAKKKKKKKVAEAVVTSPEKYCALVDGNRIPPGMPCESESIVKGDSKEYGIAAASILAKVSRDRLMRAYHELWPHFGLEQHKGYPTAAHMAAVREFGASKIHRRTFKPLKEMTFDKDGKILTDNN